MANGVIVFFTVVIAIATIAYVWVTWLLWHPHSVPDPAPLAAPDLAYAAEHARRISPELSGFVSSAIIELKFANSEFDRIRQSYRGPGLSPAALHGNGPQVYLDRANEAIDRALGILAKGTDDRGRTQILSHGGLSQRGPVQILR
jgi:hypothetical protein